MTPETYLGYARIGNYAGTPIVPDKPTRYTFANSLISNAFSYDGTWDVASEESTAIRDARLRLNFEAKNVYLVLGGRGTVQVLIDGQHTKTLRVDAQKLYTVRASNTRASNALLELRFSPGVQAYSFTFG
jgi:hypothetical protein